MARTQPRRPLLSRTTRLGREAVITGADYETVRRHLLHVCTTAMEKPNRKVTSNDAANAVSGNLETLPHAFVYACIADYQLSFDRAWGLPLELAERLGTLEFVELTKLRKATWVRVMNKWPPLHRFPNVVGERLFGATKRIAMEYAGDAGRIWSGNPGSATVVRRFLEFDGIGPKIATMAANILVRSFGVPMADRFSIDISPDVQVGRVMYRLGLIEQPKDTTQVVYAARELNPTYPGLFDAVMWDTGTKLCRPHNPRCGECKLSVVCRSRIT